MWKSLPLLLAASLTPAPQPPPSPIRLDQVGLEIAGERRIAVAGVTVEPAWKLEDADGRPVLSGTGGRVRNGVALITLSGALSPGRYTLTVEGVGRRAVTIASRPFRPIVRDGMSFFYQQRAGIPIMAGYVQRPDLARPPGPVETAVPCFSGIDRRGVRWPACAGAPRDVAGGWYDAGDRGKYVVNAGISVWTLLDAWERKPGSPLFADRALALPEAGNRVPDLLDEARWEIEWMLRMQIPPGETAFVPSRDGQELRRIDAGGMVNHKVGNATWARFPLRIEDDRGERFLYPPSTAATLNLAAVAAQAARIWRTIDPTFAARCRAAASRAFAAAIRVPDAFAEDRFEGSGGYEDDRLEDERFWAAAEIAISTHDPAAMAVLRASQPLSSRALSPPSWANTAAAGTVSLLRHPQGLDPALIASQRTMLLTAAGTMLKERAAQPYGYPAPGGDTEWGSNGALLNRALLLGTAWDITHHAPYREAARDAMDYILGRNPLDRSYVAGYGERPVGHPHHRFWAQGLGPGLPAPPPGVLSGGPNSATMVDDVARTMKGKCAPETCWADSPHAFTQNEVAINWNAPLVWVAAFLDGTDP